MFVLRGVTFLSIQSLTVLTSTTSGIFEYKNEVNHHKIFGELLVSGSQPHAEVQFSQIIKF